MHLDPFEEAPDEVLKGEMPTFLRDASLSKLQIASREDVSSELAWIASRYLELSMFQQLQSSINTRRSLLESERKANITLMLQIIPEIERPFVQPERLEIESVRDTMNDLIDRQERIRAARWVYCSIMISTLNFKDFWKHHQKDIPVLSCKGMPESVWKTLDSFDQDRLPAKKIWSWMAQPFYHERSAISKELEQIKQFIVAAEFQQPTEAFKRSFQDIVDGFLTDLSIEVVGAPSQSLPIMASRMFLALTNLWWTFEDIKGLGYLFHPTGTQACMCLNQMMDSTQTVLSFEYYIQFKLYIRDSAVR